MGKNENISSPKSSFKMENAVNKVSIHETDEKLQNLSYWLSQPPIRRIQAVTFLVRQSLKPGDKMDRTFVRKFKMKG